MKTFLLQFAFFQTQRTSKDSIKRSLNKMGTSQVGATSKAQKAQNIFLEKNLKSSKKKILSENVAQCRKM